MYLKEIKYEYADWIHVARDKIKRPGSVNTVTGLGTPGRKFLHRTNDYQLLKNTLYSLELVH
jgi:hypothetical protein